MTRRLVRYAWASPNTLVGFIFVPAALTRGSEAAIVDGVLELHGPILATILRRLIPIRGGADAITFGHIVVGRSRRALERTRMHERIHVRQCEQWGPAFIPAYLLAGLWAWLRGRGAYEGNYFERDAYRWSNGAAG